MIVTMKADEYVYNIKLNDESYQIVLLTIEEFKKLTKKMSVKYDCLETFSKKYGFKEEDFCDVLAMLPNKKAELILNTLLEHRAIKKEHVKRYWGAIQKRSKQ